MSERAEFSVRIGNRYFGAFERQDSAEHCARLIADMEGETVTVDRREVTYTTVAIFTPRPDPASDGNG